MRFWVMQCRFWCSLGLFFLAISCQKVAQQEASRLALSELEGKVKAGKYTEFVNFERVKSPFFRPEKNTAFCPYCRNMVGLAQKKASQVGDSLGHFHLLVDASVPGSKPKITYTKAVEILLKAASKMPQIYQEGIKKGSIPYELLIRIHFSEDEKLKAVEGLIGNPLTERCSLCMREVAVGFAHHLCVKGKKSYEAKSAYCPVCQREVSVGEQSGHIHGLTAFCSHCEAEIPTSSTSFSGFWGHTKGISDDSILAQWCPKCKKKRSIHGHLCGETSFCETCLVEAFETTTIAHIRHIHGLTQYCPQCGVQALMGLEKAGHIHQRTQFCPIEQTEMPYEEVTVMEDGSEVEKVKGFIFDMVVVVNNERTREILSQLRPKIQAYYSTSGEWPSNLEDVDGFLDLESELDEGLGFEYSPPTGRVRIIRTSPPPYVLVVKGVEAKKYSRGYYNKNGTVTPGEDGRYIKKLEGNRFLLDRKVYDMVQVITFNIDSELQPTVDFATGKEIKGLTSTVRAVVGTITSDSDDSVSIDTPSGSQDFTGDLVLSNPSHFKNIYSQLEKLAMDKIASQAASSYTLIKVMRAKVELKDHEGRVTTKTAYHDHGFLITQKFVEPDPEELSEEDLDLIEGEGVDVELSSFPKIQPKSLEGEERVSFWDYMLQELDKKFRWDRKK